MKDDQQWTCVQMYTLPLSKLMRPSPSTWLAGCRVNTNGKQISFEFVASYPDGTIKPLHFLPGNRISEFATLAARVSNAKIYFGLLGRWPTDADFDVLDQRSKDIAEDLAAERTRGPVVEHRRAPAPAGALTQRMDLRNVKLR